MATPITPEQASTALEAILTKRRWLLSNKTGNELIEWSIGCSERTQARLPATIKSSEFDKKPTFIMWQYAPRRTDKKMNATSRDVKTVPSCKRRSMVTSVHVSSGT
jgi:hypothetical protein